MVVKVIQSRSYFCFRYGGSLPNVNQMSGGGSLDVQNSVQGTNLRHFMWHYNTKWQWPNELKHPPHLLSGELISCWSVRHKHFQMGLPIYKPLLPVWILCQSSICVTANITFQLLETSNFKYFAWNLWSTLHAAFKFPGNISWPSLLPQMCDWHKQWCQCFIA